eukprot:SAG11_NODE_478_length_9117_cov_6.916168_4_plen_130_part_00
MFVFVTMQKEQSLLTLWGTEERTPKTTSMFAEHRMPAGWTIYGGGDGKPFGTFWPTYKNNSAKIRQRWLDGQRTFVVSNWADSGCLHPCILGTCILSECEAKSMANLHAAVALLDSAGWPYHLWAWLSS